MTRVTIGIPVYNGEAMIRECLDSILSQTYSDFTVIICDNASTDRTPDICRSYASKDSRIRLNTNHENIGHEANFRKVFSLCDTEYFCWRADDDYTSENYLEEMVKILDARPDCDLAAPSAITYSSPTQCTGTALPEPFNRTESVQQIGQCLFQYHPSTFYGLWRREALQDIINTIWKNFPHAYSRDHLTLLRPILNARIAACSEALFVQRTYSPPKGDNLRGNLTLTARIARLECLMPLFYAAFEREVARTTYSTKDKIFLMSNMKKYTYHKLRASKTRIFRLKAKRIIRKILRLEV